MSKNQETLQELYKENLELRQEKLMYYNLISIAQDQITLLTEPEVDLSFRSSLDPEFFELFLLNHQKTIVTALKNLEKQTDLIKNTQNSADPSFYTLELEQILKENIGNYQLLLNTLECFKIFSNN